MALMICCIQLNKESIGIQEFERFLGPPGSGFKLRAVNFAVTSSALKRAIPKS